MKQHYRGMTLVEILLAVLLLSLILVFLTPQLMKETHDKSADKVVSEMNQIVLAARNYYQDQQGAALGVPLNATLWPQTLQSLVDGGYIPSGLLCSSMPAAASTTLCGDHQGYALFPANAQGQYDTTLPGIIKDGLNGGGNFWGVSLTLPNAKMAEEVRQKLPFATRCSIDDLKNNIPCKVDNTHTTVTALVPRPGVFAKPLYSIDGLIQTMGSIKVCDGDCNSNTLSGGNGHNIVHIPFPTTCADPLVPVLFVYPFDISWTGGYNGTTQHTYPGITLQTTKGGGFWAVAVAESGVNMNQAGSLDFSSIYLAYFTTCSPNLDANKWDPSSFLGNGKLANT